MLLLVGLYVLLHGRVHYVLDLYTIPVGYSFYLLQEVLPYYEGGPLLSRTCSLFGSVLQYLAGGLRPSR